MIQPQNDEIVLDPACGTSGFLVFTIQNWKREIKKQKKWLDSNQRPLPDRDLTDDQKELLKEKIKNIASTHIKGVDIERDLTKVSKIWMVMVDDGHTGIHTENALISLKELKKKTSGDIDEECANIILTNPPFGTEGKEYNSEILSNFDFGHNWTEESPGKFTKGNLLSGKGKKSGQVPDILFIERCYELLKKGGRMAIVLPDGDLNNLSTRYVRNWLKDKMQIVAIVSLPRHTFLPYGANEKTSIVILKKPKTGKVEKKYPIFWYNMEKIGYDGQGHIEYKKNDNGEVLDKNGNVIPYLISTRGKNKGEKTKQDPKLIADLGAVDTEFPEVMSEWLKFRKKYRKYVW